MSQIKNCLSVWALADEILIPPAARLDLFEPNACGRFRHLLRSLPRRMQLLLLFLVLLAPAAVGAVQHQPRLQILTKPRSHQLSQALVFSAAPRVEAKSSRHPHSHPHTVARSSRRAAVGGALAFAFASAAHAVGCPCDSCSGHSAGCACSSCNTVDSSSPCAPAVDDHGLGCECDEC